MVVPETVKSVVGFPVFFGNARANRNGEINKDSPGVKLQDGQRQQLEAIAELLIGLIGSQEGHSGFLVVGYASATPIDICEICDEKSSEQPESVVSKKMEKNKDVANLRAEQVAAALRDKMRQIGSKIQVKSQKWKAYKLLEQCRPYRPELFPFIPSDDSILERMNQSVMIYAMPEMNNNNENSCLGYAD